MCMVFIKKRVIMKKLLFFILIISITVSIIFSGCTRVGSAMNGSGTIIEKNMKISEFTDVDFSGPFTIEINQSQTFEVVLSTDDNLINRVQYSIEDKTLKFSIQAPGSFFPTNLIVKVDMPVIKNAVLTDQAKASLSGFPLITDFILILKNESILNGFLEAENINFYITGGSQVGLKGTANKLQLECLDKSKINLADFILSSANVRVDGESEATLNVNGRFDVLMNGGSTIYYLGNPVFSNTSISGGSTMSRK
jgi:hypothetical protein